MHEVDHGDEVLRGAVTSRASLRRLYDAVEGFQDLTSDLGTSTGATGPRDHPTTCPRAFTSGADG